MQHYYEKTVYDVQLKKPVNVPQVRISLEEKVVLEAGASFWNNMHKDMKQYRVMKFYKGILKEHCAAEYHIWCIDRCLFFSVW